MRNAAPFRLLRSSMLAVSTLSLAAAAHTAAGGLLPDPLLLAAMAALTLLGCMMVSRWKLGTVAVLGLLGLSQLGLHQCFEWFAIGPMPTSSAGHHQHGLALMSSMTELPTPSMGSMDSSSFGMLAAHVLATVLTGLLVARGEAALWALGDWLRPLLTVLAPVVLPATGNLAIAPAPIERPTPQRFLTADRWRGPPTIGMSLTF